MGFLPRPQLFGEGVTSAQSWRQGSQERKTAGGFSGVKAVSQCQARCWVIINPVIVMVTRCYAKYSICIVFFFFLFFFV